MTAIEIKRVEKIDGLTFGALEREPLTRDIDLATFLGYAQPRDIRKLIRRHDGTANFGAAVMRATVERISRKAGKAGVLVEEDREVAEFWLTRKQAIFIAAKSETERAAELLSDVIDRFLAYEAGLREHDRIYLYLREVPDERYERLFKRRVAEAIAKLKRQPINWSLGFPVFLCGDVGRIYSWVLGRAVYETMRKHKAEDRAKGLKMHQRLTPEARQLMNVELGVVESFALQSSSVDELNAKLANRYDGAPFQLSFAASPAAE